MSIDSNSECVRSKYFTDQTDMDESLSDFQEAKKSCKGPKPALKPAKPKAKKVTKRSKGQRDIRTVLKGTKNELVSYSKEFDTVCKKSGLDVDSEQLQLAIALSKSLETGSNGPESSQALSSQQRVAKIRKTLQEYGFKVPEAKIAVGRKTKKFRKNYKLLTVTEEEKRQNITGKYTRILFENLDHSKVEQNNCANVEESEARVFHIASNILYEHMKDNNIFYVDNLVEKSVTNGSLLRDWSEIPGRPESPKHIDTYIMNFKDIDCSQDELDIVLSGPIKSVKDIFASKEIEYKKNYKECAVPKIIIEEEEMIVSDDESNKSPFQKSFNMKSPVKILLDSRSPVKRLFQDETMASEEIEIISPIKQSTVKSPFKDVIDIETSNKLRSPQQYRSCSPDIFDDELSSIMEATKPIILLSQEHKTKVFSQEIMDLTQCANIPSQNSEKGIQLSQNVTKRRSNDFMEITECIGGSSQPIREEMKEIDLTQSPEEKGPIIEECYDNNIDDNEENVSKTLSNDAERNTNSISQNITDEQQLTVLSNHPNIDSHQTEKENIDLTQSSNENDEGIPIIEENVQIPDEKALESMDLTQSSNSTDISLPLVDVANSQSQTSLDDTIIVDKDEYISKSKVKKSIFGNEALSQVFDLTQAPDTSLEYNPSPVKVVNTESCSNSFYEDFVHNHSENSKEITDVSKEHGSSHDKGIESNDDIDLTQGSSPSEEILSSQRPTILEKLPNNSSLGKREDDVSIDYDEIIIEDNIDDRESFNESEKDNGHTQQNDSSKSYVFNDMEIVDDNNDADFNSNQNSEEFQITHKEVHDIEIVCENDSLKKTENASSLTQQYNSSKSYVASDIEIVDDNNDADFNSSQNSEVQVQESFNESEKDNGHTQQNDSSKSYVFNDMEIVDDNNDADFNSNQNSEEFQIIDKEVHDIEIVYKNDSLKKTENASSLTQRSSKSSNSSKSYVDNDIEIVDDNDADFNSSQNSEIFQISDNELDYSLHKSWRDFSRDDFDFGGISVLDNVTKLGSSRRSLSEGCQSYENKNDTVEDSFLPEVYVKKTETKIKETTHLEIDKDGRISPIKVQEVLKSSNGIVNIKTPKNSEYIIKTVDVTPMADFASMSTPQRNRELDRFGLKPFKRKRAIQILTHLYNQTHPTVQQLAEEDQSSPSKKPRTNTYSQESSPKRFLSSPENSPSKKSPVKSPRKFVYKKPQTNTYSQDCSPRRIITSPENSPSKIITGCLKTPVKSPRKFVCKKPSHETRVHASPKKTDELERDRVIGSEPSSNRLNEFERDSNRFSATSRKPNETERERDIFSTPSSTKTDEIKGGGDLYGYEVTSEVAVVRSVDCNPDDWVFQKREKAKVHSCRVPLHIAFHNYVLSRRSLKEAILKYEPVNIDVIHKDLVGYGHRYDPKDLLKFLDKKCITVKTTDNNARNNKR